MNGFNIWTTAEDLTNAYMKDMRQEADKARLLHEAGIYTGAERTMLAFANFLVRLGKRLQKKYTHTHQGYQTTGGKYAV